MLHPHMHFLHDEASPIREASQLLNESSSSHLGVFIVYITYVQNNASFKAGISEQARLQNTRNVSKNNGIFFIYNLQNIINFFLKKCIY